MDDTGNRALMGTLLLLTGMILGAGVALLVAPQSGEKTRGDVIRLARKTRRRAEGAAGEFVESLSGMMDTVEGRSEELLGQGKELARESKEILVQAIEEGEKRLARQRQRLAAL
jgi:gas vesicle protein